MGRLRTSAWWIWPIIPAVAVILFLVTSGDTQRTCPPGPGPFSLPNPEQCLPTLFPSLTGGDPMLVALSWLVVGAVVYLVALTATFFVRTQGLR
jgi:hypothetical protein